MFSKVFSRKRTCCLAAYVKGCIEVVELSSLSTRRQQFTIDCLRYGMTTVASAIAIAANCSGMSSLLTRRQRLMIVCLRYGMTAVESAITSNSSGCYRCIGVDSLVDGHWRSIDNYPEYRQEIEEVVKVESWASYMVVDSLTSCQKSMIDGLVSGLTVRESADLSVDLYPHPLKVNALVQYHSRWIDKCPEYGREVEGVVDMNRNGRRGGRLIVEELKKGFIVDLLLHGDVSIKRACELVGISKARFRSWRCKDEEFSSRVLQAKARSSSFRLTARELDVLTWPRSKCPYNCHALSDG